MIKNTISFVACDLPFTVAPESLPQLQLEHVAPPFVAALPAAALRSNLPRLCSTERRRVFRSGRQQKRNRRIIEAFALSFEDVARRAIDLAGPCSFRSPNWSNHPPVAKKPNYDFEKRRKELDRKKKKEDKRLERLQRRQDGLPEDPDAVSAEPAEEHEQADGVAE